MSSLLNSYLKRFTEFWWGDRGISALLPFLILLFFLAPFVEFFVARTLLSIFFALLLVSGVASLKDRKFLQVIALVVAGAAVVLNVLHNIIPDRAINGLWYLSAIAFFFLLVSFLFYQVFRQGPVSIHRIRGAIAAYLLIGITWTFIYELIALFIPGAFSIPLSSVVPSEEQVHQSTLVYYSFVTLTTLGYGDIVPVHPVARMFAILEALIGLLYPATLLARLVSLEIIYRVRPGDENLPKEPGKGEDCKS